MIQFNSVLFARPVSIFYSEEIGRETNAYLNRVSSQLTVEEEITRALDIKLARIFTDIMLDSYDQIIIFIAHANLENKTEWEYFDRDNKERFKFSDFVKEHEKPNTIIMPRMCIPPGFDFTKMYRPTCGTYIAIPHNEEVEKV